jgi:AraC-like DNA-binding protein
LRISLKHAIFPTQNRMSAPTSKTNTGREGPFWLRAGAVWRQLAGDFEQSGFSFEWHELEPDSAVNWAGSFHPGSIEICFNLHGSGWVAANQERMDFGPETAGFFATNGRPLKGERLGSQRHRFLSLEFSITFLNQRLARHRDALHPLICRCLNPGPPAAALSRVTPLTHRHRDLLNSLLQPPVLSSAQKLWYESKALEFASEFFFCPGETEPLCTRAQHLAAERVARAKSLLAGSLAEPLSLEELGRQVGCSPFYLSRTFSQETGLTISQWLRRARLERAADLLRGGKYNVTEAALEVGYSSLSHFSQAFHEMFGCCPGLYPVRTPAQKATR